MKINKVSLDRLIATIELSIEQGFSLTVICDFDLAESIVEYVDNEYPYFSENCMLDERVNEYYITFDTFDGELAITCEFARGKHGLFKVCDIDVCAYLIFLDNLEEILPVIESEVIAICEWVEDEEYEEDCEEYECDDEEYEEYEDCCFECDCGIIDYNVEKILEVSPCPHCVREVLIGLVETIKRKYGIEVE